jgi:hypothetical protein
VKFSRPPGSWANLPPPSTRGGESSRPVSGQRVNKEGRTYEVDAVIHEYVYLIDAETGRGA